MVNFYDAVISDYTAYADSTNG